MFVFGRREAELEKAVAEIGNATAVPGDVSVAADVDRLYERERGRGLDVLFANAGIQHLATLEELLHELLVQAVQTSRGLRILSVLHARHSVGHQVHFHDRELHRWLCPVAGGDVE